MKTWTRTLNLDDAHDLLAEAEVGLEQSTWVDAAGALLTGVSRARRVELVRLVRNDFIEWTPDQRIADGLFLRLYHRAAAVAQLELVALQWALSHPITLVAVESLVAPALQADDPSIPLAAVEAVVARHVSSSSAESLRKTRTVLLGAMEGIGALVTRGTGQHRSLRASRGRPHPIGFAYLILRELEERGIDGMMLSEAVESSLGARLTQCTVEHAQRCLEVDARTGLLSVTGDEVRGGPAAVG